MLNTTLYICAKSFWFLISWCHLKQVQYSLTAVLNQSARSVDNNTNSGTATACYQLLVTGELDLTNTAPVQHLWTQLIFLAVASCYSVIHSKLSWYTVENTNSAKKQHSALPCGISYFHLIIAKICFDQTLPQWPDHEVETIEVRDLE